MKKIIKLLATVLAFCAVITSSVAFAQEFVDMPNNWTTAALKRAVENGLLNGDGDKIMPDDNITRAQMAAIIVRAFGENTPADISKFVDVSADKWYYEEFARAVNMKAFSGSDDTHLDPENFITYQECFTVVSRVFALEEPADYSCLEQFSDYAKIDEWAKPHMAQVVGNGYWTGIDGKLKPKDYITRSEFAVLMDNLVKTYINTPGVYRDLPQGNILIKSEGVIIEGLQTDDLIIIGDGLDEAKNTQINLINLNHTSTIVVRGGHVVITGTINDIFTQGDGVKIDLRKLTNRTGTIYCNDVPKLLLGTVGA